MGLQQSQRHKLLAPYCAVRTAAPATLENLWEALSFHPEALSVVIVEYLNSLPL